MRYALAAHNTAFLSRFFRCVGWVKVMLQLRRVQQQADANHILSSTPSPGDFLQKGPPPFSLQPRTFSNVVVGDPPLRSPLPPSRVAHTIPYTLRFPASDVVLL